MMTPGRVLLLAVVAAVTPAAAQVPAPPAAVITNADIDAVGRRIDTAPRDEPFRADKVAKVVNVNGEYNVGVYVVHLAKTTQPSSGNGQEHHEISEVYFVRKGSGTLVTGGTMLDPRPSPIDSRNVTEQVGPTSGGKVEGGTAHKISAGDFFIVPPNTPHYLSEVTEDIEYVIIRMDPKRLLPVTP